MFTAGRVLDQRLFAVLFDDADPDGVVAALMAYRNPDGGFGHGLEPDKRAPSSQPLDVEIAFEYLVAANADAAPVVRAACDWLVTVSVSSGAVPPVFAETLAEYPHAAHWEAPSFPAGVNPTATIAAHAHTLGVEHPWADRATEYCLGEIEADRSPSEAHDLLCLTKLLAAAPDQDRAEPLLGAVRSTLQTASFMKFDTDDPSYGLTPLHFAPSPTSIASDWFDDETLAAFLDALERDQQPDGGWPISWQPPGPASAIEWRAITTLAAMRTLRAYGR